MEVLMNRDQIKILTRTAVLLAIVVVIQIAGRYIPNNNFIVGPIVNLCLLVGVMTVGLKGGITLAVLSPFASLINNHAPIAAALIPFSPVIAAANIVLVVTFYFLYNKNKYVGLGLAALLKFGFLLLGINIFVSIFNFPKFESKLLSLFSWPQLVTALVGGIIAIPVIIRLKKAMQNRKGI